MEPARGRTNMLADCGRERDDVVLGDLLDLLDPFDLESGAGTNLARRNSAAGSISSLIRFNSTTTTSMSSPIALFAQPA